MYFKIALTLFVLPLIKGQSSFKCPLSQDYHSKIVYDETEDEEQYYKQYKGLSNKKGYIPILQTQNNIFQSSLNSFPQQQQQQQIADIPNRFFGAATTQTPTTTTPFVPLPIWKIIVPINAVTAIVYPIDEQNAAPVKFDFEELENMTSYDGSDYVKTVDVTQNVDWSPMQWYVIDVELRFVSTDNIQTCPFSSISYVCDDSYSCKRESHKLMSSTLLSSTQTQSKASVRFRAGNIPFANILVNAKVQYIPDYRRCVSELFTEFVQEIPLKLVRNSIGDVTFDGLIKDFEYKIISDVSFALNDSVTGASRPVTIFDYGNDELTINSCGQREVVKFNVLPTLRG